jgi:hypothetical protein
VWERCQSLWPNAVSNLCLVADTSLPGGRVIRELEAVVARQGQPRQCVSDNRPEFTGLATEPAK